MPAIASPLFNSEDHHDVNGTVVRISEMNITIFETSVGRVCASS